jgi:hypothetical protein
MSSVYYTRVRWPAGKTPHQAGFGGGPLSGWYMHLGIGHLTAEELTHATRLSKYMIKRMNEPDE